MVKVKYFKKMISIKKLIKLFLIDFLKDFISIFLYKNFFLYEF